MISTRITYWSASRVDAEKYMKKTIKTPSCEEWKDYLQFSLFHSSPQPFHHFSLAESADGRKRSTFAKYLQEWAPKNIFMRRSYLQIRKPCITILAVLSKFLRRLQPEDVSLTLSKMVTWRWVAVEKKELGIIDVVAVTTSSPCRVGWWSEVYHWTSQIDHSRFSVILYGVESVNTLGVSCLLNRLLLKSTCLGEVMHEVSQFFTE